MIKFDSKRCVARNYSTAVMLLLLQANVSPIDSDEMSLPTGRGDTTAVAADSLSEWGPCVAAGSQQVM